MVRKPDFNNPKTFASVLMMPTFALLIFIGIFPLGLEIYVSFTDWSPRVGDWWTANLIGGANYGAVTGDYLFFFSVLRTILMVVGAVGVEFLLGLGLAYFFVREFPGKRALVSLIIIPMMTIPAINGHMMRMIFYGTGPLNFFLSAFTGIDVTTAWLRTAESALMTIILADVWQWTPLMFLILMSGLVALPQDPINAARVLGASAWQQFRYIMIPMLKPIIVVALIIRFLEALKLFDTIYIMTRGGPGYSTQSFSIFLYELGIKHLRYGYLASEALIILGLLAVITWFAVKPIRETLK